MMKRIVSVFAALAMALSLSACGGSDKPTVTLADKDQNIRLAVGETYTLTATTTDQATLSWTTNDNTIAVVESDGTVTAVGDGVTTVTAESETGFAHCAVIVGSGVGNQVDEDGVPVVIPNANSKITAIVVGAAVGGKEDVTLELSKKTYQMRAETTPSDTGDTIVWSSADKSIAEVDQSGLVTLKAKGKTTVTATAPNGIKGECIVRVK